MDLPAQEHAVTRHTHAPGVRALADTELLLAGAFAPLDRFLDRRDVEAVRTGGRLADGTPWPAPVTFDVPAELARAVEAGDAVTVEDQEGTPVAELSVTDRWLADGSGDLAGPLRPLRPVSGGVFAWLHRDPAEVRAGTGGEPYLAVLADRALHRDTIAALRSACVARGARPLLLVPTAGDRSLPPESLVRLALAAAKELTDAAVVAVRLARRDDPVEDTLLTSCVARAYGAVALFLPAWAAAPGADQARAAIPLVAAEPVAYDGAARRWRPAAEVDDPPRAPTEDDVEALLASGDPLPDWFTPPGVAGELRRTRPPLAERGCVIFLTGLSGAGKSTVARALHDALAERADRTVTLLDGDIVRRMLSAGLGFSREDRDRNILRIGYVASEVARHGGVAICAPIAPYAATRDAVRAMVTAHGAGFVLVYVATSLAVAEARDRKGLYAKARAGLIDAFTGVSDPYEPPVDAELTIDSGEVPVDEAVRTILGYLEKHGWLRRHGSGNLSVAQHAIASSDTDTSAEGAPR